jgi:hypothetical protein
MRFPILIVTAAPMLLAVMLDAANAQDGWLKPTQHWGGLIKESGKRALAPKSKVSGAGYLDNQDALEKLFDAWGLKEKPPKIDFKKQIVFVQTSDGPNLPRAFFTLDAAGKLTADFKQTDKGGPGFGYSIDVLDRTGIKSYQGKPLE